MQQRGRAIQQGDQRRLRHMQQRRMAVSAGVMRAGLAVEHADFAKPVDRFQHGQQGFPPVCAGGADPDRAFHHAVQAVGRVATLEEKFPGPQAPDGGNVDQGVLQGRVKRAEPAAGVQPFAEGAGVQRAGAGDGVVHGGG